MRVAFYNLFFSLLVFSAFSLHASAPMLDPDCTLKDFVKGKCNISSRDQIRAFSSIILNDEEVSWNSKVASIAPPGGEQLNEVIKVVSQLKDPILVLGGGNSGFERFTTDRHVILDLHEDSVYEKHPEGHKLVIGKFDFNNLGHWCWLASRLPNTFNTILFDVGTAYHTNWTIVKDISPLLIMMKRILRENGECYLPVLLESVSPELSCLGPHKIYSDYTEKDLLELNTKCFGYLLSPAIKKPPINGQGWHCPLDEKPTDPEMIERVKKEVTEWRLATVKEVLSKTFGQVTLYRENVPYPELGDEEWNAMIREGICFVVK